ncbi:alpha/beta hydrolase-fold protein [Herbiconiux sp. CPCC 205763]|uniref:Alpha/beta hydrolase-fold protein n=1 Tax=Herbiconiux aconitum TaxID=2970913 RepID=A0ABT2GQZ4_9MICO|nr:alpha/beta hydrolase-fold protein [Herbiconiux aconitum]MCS5718646.1 alpha/beta hydrolase-fold protein [Herbiconiux aconitum]
MKPLLDVGLLSGPLVIAVYAAAAIAALLLLFVRPGPRWRRSHWLVVALGAAVVGAAVGIGLTWLLNDALDLFGAELTPVVRLWIALGFAGFGVAIASFWWATWRRVIASILAIVLFAGATAMTINIDFGQYPTVRSALGLSAYAGDVLPTIAKPDPATQPTIATWTAPADLPTQGAVGTVTIPATASGFHARDAVVYLPPAALTADPPKLPVLIMMSGQPGSPDAPLDAAKLRQSLDAYAAAHQGLAPIVVSPDQLGSPDVNPMCVDSPIGNSATYLTVDVPAWITANLPVLPGPRYWGIGGYSQGGTCSIQLGAAHPELFGAILDASGEEFPKLGDPQTTIDKGFGGDAAKYAAAYPAAIMAAHTPYSDMFAVFGVGSDDSVYLPGVKTLYADAQAAGMTATYIESPGSAHDATTWAYVFKQGLGLIADHWGLNR